MSVGNATLSLGEARGKAADAAGSGAAARTQRIDSIQYLRFVAAFMVLFGHTTMMMHDVSLLSDGNYALFDLFPWGAGVDIFFIISGFIIAFVIEGVPGGSRGATDFTARRIIRIVPIYWIYTLIFVAGTYLTGFASSGRPPLDEVVTSLLFIPYPHSSDSVLRPVLGQGWTLNYEMFFYLCTAVCLIFLSGIRKRVVAATILTLFVIGSMMPDTGIFAKFFGYSVILEFLLGFVLFQLFSSNVRIGSATAVALVAAGLVLLLAFSMVERAGWYWDEYLFRFFARGVPAFLIAAGFSLVPGTNARSWFGKACLLLGDSSYSLYLVHPFIIIPGLRVLRHASFLPAPVIALTLIAACLIASILSFKLVEKPITRFLTALLPRRQSRQADRVPVTAG